jgi:hypothetical protein
MDERLRNLLETLAALIPSADQRAALRKVTPDVEVVREMAESLASEKLRAAVATFFSPKRAKALEALQDLGRKLDGESVNLDKPEKSRKAIPHKQILAALERVLPSKAELAQLEALRGESKADAKLVGAAITAEQLARMKDAVLPGKQIKRLAAAVLTEEQRKRLHASKLPKELIARIEASRPKAEQVARLQAMSEQVAAVEKAMASGKKRARIDAFAPSEHEIREAAAGRLSAARWKRIETLAADILKEVRK